MDIFRSSSTARNRGVLLIITQQFGDILTSQLVNANRASIATSDETPCFKWTNISTSLAVLSSTFFILIFPETFAFRMVSIRLPVVVLYGTDVMESVDLSTTLISALRRIFPPLDPPLY